MFSVTTARAEAIIADHSVATQFDLIPESIIEQIGEDYRFFYGRTSHGSQIMTGLTMLQDENPQYTQPYFKQVSDDLGHNGDTSWAPITRDYLNSYPDINVVMWSWCGGSSEPVCP